jgi:transcriptional regulator with XRE-family HTH domain
MTISFQRASRHDLDLALPIQRDFTPLADRCLPDPKGAGKGGLRSEMGNSVLFFHGALSMAYRTDERKNTVPALAYALGMETITERINELLADSGLEAADLARRLGVSKQTMTDWTKGRTTNIKPDNLLKIIEYFSIEVRWLVTGKGPKYSQPKAPPEIQRATEILIRMPPALRTAFVSILENGNPH